MRAESRVANIAPASGRRQASFQRLSSFTTRPSFALFLAPRRLDWARSGPWQASQATLISLNVVL
jgi:hypothetical protein